jgi:hypothetical protein
MAFSWIVWLLDTETIQVISSSNCVNKQSWCMDIRVTDKRPVNFRVEYYSVNYSIVGA